MDDGGEFNFVKHRGYIIEFIKGPYPYTFDGERDLSFDHQVCAKQPSPPRQAGFFGCYGFKIHRLYNEGDKYEYFYLGHRAPPIDIILAMFKNLLPED